jgi:probable phosphoglycerate mutase
MTDIPLTPTGEQQVSSTSGLIAGAGKLIDPARLAKVYISPLQRAQKTFTLLFNETDQWYLKGNDLVETTADLKEWDYGAYEGLLTAEIRQRRKDQGLDTERPWDIWRDGCEGGEAPSDLANRLDEVIAKIKQLQAPYMHGEEAADVLVIAHGHTLRALAKRWIGFEMGMRLPLMLEAGAVGVLSYEHHRVDEPALLLGVNLGSSS